MPGEFILKTRRKTKKENEVNMFLWRRRRTGKE